MLGHVGKHVRLACTAEAGVIMRCSLRDRIALAGISRPSAFSSIELGFDLRRNAVCPVLLCLVTQVLGEMMRDVVRGKYLSSGLVEAKCAMGCSPLIALHGAIPSLTGDIHQPDSYLYEEIEAQSGARREEQTS